MYRTYIHMMIPKITVTHERKINERSLRFLFFKITPKRNANIPANPKRNIAIKS